MNSYLVKHMWKDEEAVSSIPEKEDKFGKLYGSENKEDEEQED